MKNLMNLTLSLLLLTVASQAQTPMQFSGQDCNGNAVDLFADLDAGKAVVLHFYMPNCGSCPPSAKRIQTMTSNLSAMYPGKIKGYAFPYQNSTTCTYSSSWVSSNNLGTLYAPMDSGADHVANYGGFGMPTVVLLGGKGVNRRVMFSSLSFSTSDTLEMRDSILALLNSSTGISEQSLTDKQIAVYPNPAKESVYIQIDLKESTLLEIDILDFTGKQVAEITSERLSGMINKQLNIASMQNGIYFVRVQCNGRTLTKKLSIHH